MGTGQCIISTQEGTGGVGGENKIDAVRVFDAKGEVKNALSRSEIIGKFREKSKVAVPPIEGLTLFEKRLLALDPKLWHERLSFSEIEHVKRLREQVQEHRQNHLAL